MIYNIEIKETLSRIIDIESDSIEEALKSVNSGIDNCDIVLDDNDFVNREVNEYKDTESN